MTTTFLKRSPVQNSDSDSTDLNLTPMTPLTPYEQGAVIVYETAEIPEEIDFRPKTSSVASITQEEKKFLWQKSAEKESPVIPSYAATTEPQVERCAENNEGKIGKISEQRKEIFNSRIQ